jgi:hypothetical protein
MFVIVDLKRCTLASALVVAFVMANSLQLVIKCLIALGLERGEIDAVIIPQRTLQRVRWI